MSISIHVSDLIPLLAAEHPKHLNELAAELKLPAAARPELEALLAQLVGYGLAHAPEPQRYLLTRPEVRGTLTMTPRGFAFVTPELSSEPNIYVDRLDLSGALHRDRVALALYTGPDGRLRGRVTRVLERGTRSFVGVYREAVSQGAAGSSEGLCYIYPQSDRLPTQVPVERTLEPLEGGRAPVDGDLVAALLVPPEEGASPALGLRAQARALLEDSRGPAIDAAGAVARVLHVIEPASAQGALEAVIYDQGLTLHLPSAVDEAAEAFPPTVTPEEVARRKDLRHLPFVTIDPESAKDFDDSVYTQPLRGGAGGEGGEGGEGGGWRLLVAI
ncbi:MAG: RNB domain-containing ribonuclease, partial [Deltaproteobacteria bacterium]|nr:RNB domain-containing ribonuclease [Deltaproteobacteria bacterium]